MMPEDEGAVFYERFLRRTVGLIAAFGAVGTLAAGILRGWRFGLAFLMGAGLSYVSFRRWRRVAESLGSGVKPGSAWGMMVRLALLVAACYVIIKSLELNPLAVFLGLLVAAAAVTATVLLELIYGT